MTTRDHARAAAFAALGCVAVGALAGVLWGLIAPGQHLYVTDSGRLSSLYLESTNIFAATAIFLLVTAVAGVLCGASAWAWRTARGPMMAVAVLVGGLVGAWSAAELGGVVARARLHWPGDAGLADLVGQVVVRPPSISLWVALIGQALAAGVVYLFAAGLSPDSDLGAGHSDPDPCQPDPVRPGISQTGNQPDLR